MLMRWSWQYAPVSMHLIVPSNEHHLFAIICFKPWWPGGGKGGCILLAVCQAPLWVYYFKPFGWELSSSSEETSLPRDPCSPISYCDGNAFLIAVRKGRDANCVLNYVKHVVNRTHIDLIGTLYGFRLNRSLFSRPWCNCRLILRGGNFFARSVQDHVVDLQQCFRIFPFLAFPSATYTVKQFRGEVKKSPGGNCQTQHLGVWRLRVADQQ